MGKKRYWLDEDLAKAIQGIVGRESLAADPTTDASVGKSQSGELISCVLHADIESMVHKVDCTRLMMIPHRGDKKAWQVITEPDGASEFMLTVNGTTIGTFTGLTTTAELRSALSAITSPSTPDGWVIHGNFFIFPTETLFVASGESVAKAHEVQWTPLVGDANATTVGCRRPAVQGDFKRGSTQAAEWITGYGFAISNPPPQPGGAGQILFRVLRIRRGVGLNCNCMECVVLNVSCGETSVAIGDVIDIYDELGCVFNAPERILIGIRGYAKKMSNPSYALNDPLVFEPGTEHIAKPVGNCRWSAERICCAEEE